MNKQDSDRIQELCSLITAEQDRQRFLRLVEELNTILESQNRQVQNEVRSGPS